MWGAISRPSLGLPCLPITHRSVELHSGSNDLRCRPSLRWVSILLEPNSPLSFSLALGCWTASAALVSGSTTSAKDAGKDTSVWASFKEVSQMYKSNNLHLNTEGNMATSFNSSFHLCSIADWLKPPPRTIFYCSQPSFPFPIRNRPVWFWLLWTLPEEKCETKELITSRQRFCPVWE